MPSARADGAGVGNRFCRVSASGLKPPASAPVLAGATAAAEEGKATAAAGGESAPPDDVVGAAASKMPTDQPSGKGLAPYMRGSDEGPPTEARRTETREREKKGT